MNIYLTEHIENKNPKLMVNTNQYFSQGINASSKIPDLGLKHVFYLDILNKISLKLEFSGATLFLKLFLLFITYS